MNKLNNILQHFINCISILFISNLFVYFYIYKWNVIPEVEMQLSNALWRKV